METSPETCVLFAALELCDSQIANGLKHFQNSDSNVDTKETFQILVSTVDEIVTGLELEHSQMKKDHWKFRLTSILTALAMREEFSEYLDLDSDFYLVLSDFRSINFRLLFDLITHCGLDQAFVHVLQAFDIKLKLHLTTKCIEYLCSEKQSERLGTVVLLETIVCYVFLHKDCLISTLACVKERDENTNNSDASTPNHDVSSRTGDVGNQQYNVSATGYDVIEKLLRLMSDLLDETNSVERMEQVYMVLFVGLLNVLSLAYLLPVYMYKAPEINRSNIADPNLNSKERSRSLGKEFEEKDLNLGVVRTNIDTMDVTKTIQYQMFQGKYGLLPEQYKDVMQRIFTDNAEKQIQEKRLPGQNLPLEFIAHSLEILSFMLNNEEIVSAVSSALLFCRNSNNVMYAASEKWQNCCFMSVIFKKLYGNIENMHTIPMIKTYLKAKGRMDKIRTIQNSLLRSAWQGVVKTDPVNEHELFCLAIVTIGEKLGGWETSFDWMLTDCSTVHESKWFQCLEDNAEFLLCTENTALLWKRLLDCRSRQKRDKSMMKIVQQLGRLFLDVFTKHPLHTQNELLKLVYESEPEDLDAIFASNKTRIFAKLTVLLNRLVEVERNVECGITNQIAALALQCPETVLGSLMKHATQNHKQCDIVVALLQKLSALAIYKAPSSTLSLLIESVQGLLRRAGDMTKKEQRNALYFIMCVSAPPKRAENVRDKIQIENSKQEKAKSERKSTENKANIEENTSETPLVYFTDVISHCVLPQIYDVTKYDDDTDLIYDVTSVSCLQILDKILTEHRRAKLKKEMSLNLMVLLHSTIELLVSWEREVTSDTIHLLCDSKEHIMNIITSLQILLASNENQLLSDELNWFAKKLCALPWYFKGYVIPLKCAVQLLFGFTPGTLNIDDLMLYLPASAKQLVNPSDINLFEFSDNVPEYDNPWISLMLAATTSDDLCAHIGDCLKECRMTEPEYKHYISALVGILPCKLDIEWVRMAKFTQTVFSKSATGLQTDQRNGESLVVKRDAVITMFDAAFVLLESSKDLGVVSHLLKAFTHALYCLLDCTDQTEIGSPGKHVSNIDSSGNDNLLVNGSGMERLGNDNINDSEITTTGHSILQTNERIDTEFTYLSRMCMLFSQIPPDAQEPLIGVLLDLVDRLSCSLKKNSPSLQKTGRDMDDIVSKLCRVAENTLCADIQNVVIKKLEECGVVNRYINSTKFVC